MKIIDDEAFFEYQTEWFKAQFQKGDPSGVWKDHKQVMFAYKMAQFPRSCKNGHI